jgi:hypothetical protein
MDKLNMTLRRSVLSRKSFANLVVVLPERCRRISLRNPWVCDSKRVPEVISMKKATSHPTTRLLSILRQTTRRKTTMLPKKAKRGDGREPLKPLLLINFHIDFSFLRAHNHIVALGAVLGFGHSRRNRKLE